MILLRLLTGVTTRHIPALILAGALLAGAAAGIVGLGTSAEHVVKAWSAQLRQHPASGGVHIVEIDARSIAAIDRWPWSRAEHARVIDRLVGAGASVVAFDVDFSSRAGGDGDAALAAAIDRADGKVVLATLRQAAGFEGTDFIDSLPAPALRDRAALAAVSVAPDDDGNVREAPLGTVTDDIPRPSLSAMLAGRSGAADQPFPIDYAIDPSTIPRHSFIDIRDGRFDPASVRGRQIIIGATAVELGDRYPVPVYGVIPGVVIQALATETLYSGIPAELSWPVSLAIAALLGLVVLRIRGTVPLVVAGIAAPLVIFAAGVTVRAMSGATFAYVPALIVIVIAILGAAAMQVGRLWLHRRMHDVATGLPNRLALAATSRERRGAVVVARIVDFEKLAAGLSAEAIAHLFARICDRVRLVGNGAELHRVGENMLGWITTVEIDRAGDQYDRLRVLMLSPVEVDGRRIDVALTIGVALRQQDDAMRTIAHAALAAEQAHADGSGYHIHDSAAEEAVDRDLSLLGELSDAVANRDLHVLYQPKLDIARRSIASVEALVRWNHPTRGLLRPDLFIPLAERNDRIAGLTLFVIEQTLFDLDRWARAGHPLTAAVNISAKLLSSADFKAALALLLEASDVPPTSLIFEITESAAMTDPDGAGDALNAFRAIGIAISMDDYGTGQSTLSYLKRLPLNELKIDRSFVQFAHQNRGDAILVRSTIDLAHELGLKVVAEGVEDEGCLDFLASVGCDMAQGYLISKPVAADAVATLLATEAAQAA